MNRLAVIILTYNEEKNIAQCLKSLDGVANEIFVLDSFSSDTTCQIAENYTRNIYKNEFKGYSEQRNWALENLPIQSDWVLWLDADEYLSKELRQTLLNDVIYTKKENGYVINRRLVFKNKNIWWGGYYPIKILRMFRLGKGRCENRSVNEHFIVEGKIGFLKGDIIHKDNKGMEHWLQKHKKYARLEAEELIKTQTIGKSPLKESFKSQAAFKRMIRERIWNYLPPFLRPIFYFLVRYILLLGFLDGWKGFYFHTLQGLWFPMLIDYNYLKLKISGKKRLDKPSVEWVK